MRCLRPMRVFLSGNRITPKIMTSFSGVARILVEEGYASGSGVEMAWATSSRPELFLQVDVN